MTGNDLLDRCMSKTPFPTDLPVCTYFITGVMEGMLTREPLDGPHHTYCPPDDLAPVTVVSMLLKAKRDYPGTMTLSAGQMVGAVLEDQYPCKKSN